MVYFGRKKYAFMLKLLIDKMSKNLKDKVRKMGNISHINENREQSILEHLENVAHLTEDFCKSYDIPGIDAAKYAYMVGLAHDIGKYSEAFQKKIQYGQNIQVDHSTAGARELCKVRMPEGAFAAAGHHGGIPNGNDSTEKNLIFRVQHRKLENYDTYKKEIKLTDLGRPRLSDFEISFFIRMIFSALVDADFLDTEDFMCEGKISRGGYDSLDTLYEKMMGFIAPWLDERNVTTEINKIRTEILKKCLMKGVNEKGIFSLTVPTGAGKTISSLAFALKHAKVNKMDRIIYVIPYTSIIEQNVGVFRNILGDKNVLAHYSNAFVSMEKNYSDLYEKHKLSTENWDIPVIVTTNVQFFESLYSNKTSKCRKLHNIANSVIIFDEAQMIPLNYIKPCTRAIRTLVENYNVSAVLCTATQPALDKWLMPLKVNEICDDYSTLFQKLKRANIKSWGKVSEEQIIDKMKSYQQVLTIVNTKKEAQTVFENLPEEGRFHLSTYMLPIHRKRIIDIIRKRLTEGKVCRVVATSLIEAGVDIDFPVVLREEAGLDSIIQAAGRCNREGKRDIDKSIVWVFRREDKVPDIIAKNVAILEETMQKYNNYDDMEAMQYYFSSLQMLDEASLDAQKVVERFEKKIDGIEFPFKLVNELFHLIASDTKTLIVPIDEEAGRLLDEINRRIDMQENFNSVLRKLGIYSLNIYENEYEKMMEDGSAYELIDGVAVLQILSLYTEDKGLCYEKSNGGMMI